MKTTVWWLRIVFLLVPLTISACSAAIVSSDDLERTEDESVLHTKEDIEVAQDTVPGDETEGLSDDGEISPRSDTEIANTSKDTPTVDPELMRQGQVSCEDPFKGVDIRFNPRGWETDFCEHSVPYDQFLSGGPPRDGIPPIDEPNFVGVDLADDWLADSEPVIVLDLNGD